MPLAEFSVAPKKKQRLSLTKQSATQKTQLYKRFKPET
jgi:hypothetical protein